MSEHLQYPGPQQLNPEVVITAGGTREPIDDVRYVGNFSSGALGHALASEFQELGHRVLLLAPKEVTHRYGEIEGVEHRQFTDFRSLRGELLGIPAARIVMHAAAVADYSPVRAEGKIRSDQDELVVHMRRNPKILKELRPHFGDKTFIAGFKLLSGVSWDELIDTGFGQISENQTDMCVANDLQDIGRTRKLYAIPAEGLVFLDGVEMVGDNQNVARQLANFTATWAERGR